MARDSQMTHQAPDESFVSRQGPDFEAKIGFKNGFTRLLHFVTCVKLKYRILVFFQYWKSIGNLKLFLKLKILLHNRSPEFSGGGFTMTRPFTILLSSSPVASWRGRW